MTGMKWSQHSKPTLFSEIKPRYQHKRGEAFVFKIWQIDELLQFESNYMSHRKFGFVHNPHVMTAIKTFLNWLLMGPNSKNLTFFFC